MKAVILVGPPGSGKTTYAKKLSKELCFVRVNRDDIRDMFGLGYQADTERIVKRVQSNAIIECAVNKNNVVIDNTHLKKGEVTKLQSFLISVGYQEVVVYDDFCRISFKQLVNRNVSRTDKKIPFERLQAFHQMAKDYLGISEQEDMPELTDEELARFEPVSRFMKGKDQEITVEDMAKFLREVLDYDFREIKDQPSLMKRYYMPITMSDFNEQNVTLNEFNEKGLDVLNDTNKPEKKNTVTIEQIQKMLDESEKHEVVLWGKELITSFKLKNGFTLLGKGACVDPANFDIEIGRKICREQAENELWKLEGYRLQCKLYESGELK